MVLLKWYQIKFESPDFQLENVVRIMQWILPSPLWWVHMRSTQFFCWNLANQWWVKVICCSASGLLEHANLKFWLTVNSRYCATYLFLAILLISNVLWYKDLYSASFTKYASWSTLCLTMTYSVSTSPSMEPFVCHKARPFIPYPLLPSLIVPFPY